MVGWAIAWKVLATKNGRGLMKMLTLEDRTDVFEAVLFPRVYARYAPRTLTGGPYLVEGRVDISLGSPTLNIDRLELLR
jgi:DNA polymerase III alpha subunit